ncbi:MAG: hypothetical protein DRJ65_01675 [Acidobacteria bacterium]|nr:MAG: hypothetical protein DRJ65_01675 [Acidobacteriota bacterium]
MIERDEPLSFGRGMRPSKVLKLIFVWAILIVAMGEIGIRLFVDLPIDYVDEKSACYRYDPTLGWFPREAADCIHSAKFDTEINNNTDGFRDRDHDLTRGGSSMAFLGDSFVWGYDVKAEKRFTSVIQAFLPDWSILNMGVSGYGTDQEYLLLQGWYPKYTPDIVVLVVHTNDSIDNSTNFRDNYYKPYFEGVEGHLVLKGTPVPKCYRFQQAQHPFAFRSHFVRGLAVLYNRINKPERVTVTDLKLPLIAAMNHYVTERGSLFRVVFTYRNDSLDETSYLEERNIRYLHVPTDLKFEDYGQHWTEEGHASVAAKILERLYREGLITDDDLEKYPSLN